MQDLPVHRYRRLSSWMPFDRISDHFYGVLVFTCALPPVAAAVCMLAGLTAPAALVAWVGGAACVSLAISIWLMHGLLAPVSLAREALRAYRREQRVVPLPLDLGGEGGGLLNDLRATIETCERQRQIFSEQVEWAFRSKPSPLLDDLGAPRRAPLTTPTATPVASVD
ncbi:hypothetical protein [Solimonas marina]|uniref:Uncharacterized protein n=1 Tax=Solimonas marina TaxID=2714601 RepID=A0A969W8B7_9GAMM|nr:hypothetical protein [Solimonas marina]NKF20806.1 hypothetical protein [Solimonas marina]